MRKRRRDRGQGTIEFAILFGAVIFFFVVFIGVLQLNIADKNSEKQQVFARNIAIDIRDEVGFAAESGDGYSREFYVPENLLGVYYEVAFIDDYIVCNFSDYKYTYRIAHVNGQVQKGKNLIQKIGEEIYVNS